MGLITVKNNLLQLLIKSCLFYLSLAAEKHPQLLFCDACVGSLLVQNKFMTSDMPGLILQPLAVTPVPFKDTAYSTTEV